MQKELRTALVALYPGAIVFIFKKAGHFPYINEAKRYNEVIEAFLKS